jgi:hypothetical protein
MFMRICIKDIDPDQVLLVLRWYKPSESQVKFSLIRLSCQLE